MSEKKKRNVHSPEFKAKIGLEALLDAIRDKASRDGVPYQRFIRIALEKAVQSKNKPYVNS